MAQRVVRHPDAFSKDGTSKKRPRQTAGKHLAWIRTLPCLISGRRSGGVEAAHIRYRDPVFGKPGTAHGQKPDDRWTIPLHANYHRLDHDAQHDSNEREWWVKKGIDPVAVASALWGCTGDDEMAEIVIREARQKAGLA